MITTPGPTRQAVPRPTYEVVRRQAVLHPIGRKLLARPPGLTCGDRAPPVACSPKPGAEGPM